jgi:hypothetical protein
MIFGLTLSDEPMTDILFQRPMSSGPVVRVRRLTDAGVSPVRAVLEVDRRSGRARTSHEVGFPPSLMAVEGDSEAAVLEALQPFAADDAAVARLVAQQQAR